MYRRLLIIALGCVAAGFAEGATQRGNPRPADGSYNANAAGAYTGTGTAQVSGKVIRFALTVTSSTGEKGDLTASNLGVDGNHFTGTGSVLGLAAIFKGRIDAPDNDLEQNLKGVRVVCTFSTSDGRYGRIIGFVPATAKTTPPPPTPPGNGDDHDRKAPK